MSTPQRSLADGAEPVDVKTDPALLKRKSDADEMDAPKRRPFGDDPDDATANAGQVAKTPIDDNDTPGFVWDNTISELEILDAHTPGSPLESITFDFQPHLDTSIRETSIDRHFFNFDLKKGLDLGQGAVKPVDTSRAMSRLARRAKTHSTSIQTCAPQTISPSLFTDVQAPPTPFSPFSPLCDVTEVDPAFEASCYSAAFQTPQLAESDGFLVLCDLHELEASAERANAARAGPSLELAPQNIESLPLEVPVLVEEQKVQPKPAASTSTSVSPPKRQEKLAARLPRKAKSAARKPHLEPARRVSQKRTDRVAAATEQACPLQAPSPQEQVSHSLQTDKGRSRRSAHPALKSGRVVKFNA